ncbi:MAG: hypothetical protein RLZZ623_3560 [Actinomycetota bacterium]
MDFEVRRTDLRQHRIVNDPVPDPMDGQVVLRVDHAALTANNITYGAFGELMGYWRFFPAADGWGRVPVWGFADVISSRAKGVEIGERVYGYFPMSTHLVVEPGRVSATTFVDVSEHRASLPPVYNQYLRLEGRVFGHTSERGEQIQAVFRPLFTTSFLIDDWLASEQMFGATSVVIASASSKTALGLAALLSANRDVEVVGLTSAANAEFVGSVGYYDRVVVYGEVAALDASRPTVLVDMGGNAAVVAEVHTHFGDALLHSCQVGATHWEHVRFGVEVPGPTPTLFFAPDHVVRRSAEWGAPAFEERVRLALDVFIASVDTWLELVVHRGPDAVAAAFIEVLEGRVPPRQAFIISL